MLAFTYVHVLLSLVGIFSGLVVAGGFAAGKRFDGWTGLFLVTTAATSLSGYGFPFVTLLPSHVVGAISLAVLAVTVAARYAKHLVGWWRTVFVVGSVAALWMNCFVLVAQLFLRLPALQALAPTGKEPIFGVTQLIVLGVFVAVGRAAMKGFRAGAEGLARPA